MRSSRDQDSSLHVIMRVVQATSFRIVRLWQLWRVRSIHVHAKQLFFRFRFLGSGTSVEANSAEIGKALTEVLQCTDRNCIVIHMQACKLGTG